MTIPSNKSLRYTSAEQGTVVRPQSNRRVSAIAELNRLLGKYSELKKAALRNFLSKGCGCCANVEEQEKAYNDLAKAVGADRYEDNSGWDLYSIAYEALGRENPHR